MVRVKQVNVTANYAWSPAEFHPIQIATATAAQQLDATFNTSANLSLYTVDLSDPSKDLALAGQVGIPNRFYKVIWGHGGLESSSTEDCRGIVVCGADNGLISVYDPKKLIDNSDGEAALISSNSKHTGPVKALDFNPFQKNLYASGASDSEIFIWDLKNPSNPMTPGKKTEPLASISCVAWNRQVQHILGSSTSVTSGPCCVVWDLRKNAPIIKVQDPAGRMQCSEIAWHPDVATQLVLASEDDRSPVVQLWDLRFANSPLKVLESHNRGIVSVAWCQQDPDLLMTCGKDNRVLCWNPNSTPPEILYEVPSAVQWCFDVQWCPRNPAMISMGSFDGHIGIQSLMGGSTYTDLPNKQQQDALAESFGGSAFAAAPAEQPQVPKKVVSMPLKKPPKWICKPCGATFLFGGKLVTFRNNKPSSGQQQEAVRRTVSIHQVVTETEFIDRSEELQNALNSNQFAEYCQKKMESAPTVFEEDLWSFLKAKFEPEPRKQFLHLLGYDANKIRSKIIGAIGSDGEENLAAKVDDISLDSSEASHSVEASDPFEMIANNRSESDVSLSETSAKPMVLPSGDEALGLTTNGLDVPSTKRKQSRLSILQEDSESLISQALLVGDYESAVSLCLRENRMADAIVLAIAGGPQLLERTQGAYFARCTSKIARLMFAVATKNWAEIVATCDLSNWKEALATLLTYSNQEEMNALCNELGARLESSPDHKIHACLCYICSGNVEKLVGCWNNTVLTTNNNKSAPEASQDLIEKVMILRKAVEGVVGLGIGQAAAEKLANYASILASQGKLEAAMGYLPDSVEKLEIKLLRERLRHALGLQQQAQPQQTQFQRQPQQAHQRSAGYNRAGYMQPVQQTQPAYSSQMQPVQKQLAQPMPTRSEPSSTNPYRTQAKSGFAVAPAPTDFYTPQDPPVPTGPPDTMNGYNSGMAPQPAGGTYQPQMTPSPQSQPAGGIYQPQMTPSPQSQTPAQYTPPSQPANIPTDAPVANNRGWNDPPALDPNRVLKKKKTPLQSFQPQNYNIMTPMQPVAAPTPLRPSMPTHQPGLMPMQLGPVPVSAPQYGLQPNGPPGAPHGNQPQTPAPSVPTAAAKDVPKAPIPQEHQILQTHFENLIKRCIANAANAQTKRKLDDCERRMEFLYDKLRANTLSSNIVTGLHQVAQFISAHDYASGLRQHTQIVSSSNFSEISAFMPGLKSMLQIAIQLRV